MNLRAIFLKMGSKIRKSPSKYITREGSCCGSDFKSAIVTAGGLAEFSKQISFKTPKCPKFSRASREKVVGGFYYFSKVSKK